MVKGNKTTPCVDNAYYSCVLQDELDEVMKVWNRHITTYAQWQVLRSHMDVRQ